MERIRKESGAAVMVTLQQEYYYKYLLKLRMIPHHQSHPNGKTVRKLIEVGLMNALNINLLSIIYND